MSDSDTTALTQLDDTQLAAEYDSAVEQYQAALERFAQITEERFRRAVRRAASEEGFSVASVSFGSDAWENGVFLTIEEGLDAAGQQLGYEQLEAIRDEVGEALLAELTDARGVFLGWMEI